MESPSHLRDHPLEVTLPLLAALLYCREREITDMLVELLISTVYRINARAEVKVTKELIKEFQRVMLQDLLAEPDWDDVLTPEDRRGLTRCSGPTSCRTAR